MRTELDPLQAQGFGVYGVIMNPLIAAQLNGQ